MKFEYKFRTTGFELWQLSMYYIYGSMVGVCNIVFTGAVFALLISRWNQAGNGIRFFLVLSCCLFPVIQPLLIFLKAKKQADCITQDTEAGFDEEGLHIKVGEESSDIGWDRIGRISKKPTMIIVFSDTTHGFIFTNQVLGDEKRDFYTFVASKVKPEGK